uniref:S100 calcium binding protein U n=2 Tax=Cyprinus carpio TaxID=7962 RepID=A0A8C1N4U7_CYPCA
MEAAIKTVVSVFLKSSKGKENLGGKEFQSLVKSQLKNILTGTEDNEAVKNMRQQLDNNEDGKVSFQEYMNLIGYLAQSVSEQLLLNKHPLGLFTIEIVNPESFCKRSYLRCQCH